MSDYIYMVQLRTYDYRNSVDVVLLDDENEVLNYFEMPSEEDARELYDVLENYRITLNALYARMEDLPPPSEIIDQLKELKARVQELEAENARLRERIQRVTEETARIVNDMYEKEQNDPATEIEARLFVSGMLSYADYTGDDSDAMELGQLRIGERHE